jgi:hypothetical protein
MTNPSDGVEVVRFPDVAPPPDIDEKEQYAAMMAACKKRGGLSRGENLIALPEGTQSPQGWSREGKIRAPSGNAYDVYVRKDHLVNYAFEPEVITASPNGKNKLGRSAPPGNDALQDIDENFSPEAAPDGTVQPCVSAFAKGFVKGAVVGYAVGFVLAALGPAGVVIGAGLLLYSAYEIVTNWEQIVAGPPEKKAQMLGELMGGVVGGGLGARHGRLAIEPSPGPVGKPNDVFKSSPAEPAPAEPKIGRQQQSSHIKGTPENLNRVKQGKPTSTFDGDKATADALTQEAWSKGKPVPGRPHIREHDFGRRVGTGPKGGGQNKVRVHRNSKGQIHGHPSGPEN